MLTQDEDNDYTLAPKTNCWINIGPLGVCLEHHNDYLVCEIYDRHYGMDSPRHTHTIQFEKDDD